MLVLSNFVDNLGVKMDSEDKRMFMLRIDEKPVSNNIFYMQSHWSKRSDLKNFWHGLVNAELAKYGKSKIKPFKAPFVTIMYAIYKNRAHLPDLDNLMATHKLITDALQRRDFAGRRSRTTRCLHSTSEG